MEIQKIFILVPLLSSLLFTSSAFNINCSNNECQITNFDENSKLEFKSLINIRFKKTLRFSRTLNITNSKMSRIPREILDVFTKIEYLGIYGTGLSQLSSTELKHFKQLKYLVAPYNQIDRIDSNFFIKSSKLEHIDLSWNHINDISVNSIVKLVNLHSFDLRGNDCINIDYNFNFFKRFSTILKIMWTCRLKRKVNSTVNGVVCKHIVKLPWLKEFEKKNCPKKNIEDGFYEEIEPDEAGNESTTEEVTKN